jgi:hypothetical protein
MVVVVDEMRGEEGRKVESAEWASQKKRNNSPVACMYRKAVSPLLIQAHS